MGIHVCQIDSFADFQQMDITAAGDDNAVLLAVSAILTQAAADADEASAEAELSSLLSKIGADIEDDGELDSDSLRERIVLASMHLDLAATRSALEARLDELDADGDVPAFEDYVDSDGDGVLNLDDDDVPSDFEFEPVVNAYLATEYESNAVTLKGLADEGFTRVRVEGATLVVNGNDLDGDSTELGNGDVVALRVTSSEDFEAELVGRLDVGEVTKTFRVETGTEEDYGDVDGDDVVNVDDDDMPEAFDFAPVTGAERMLVVRSETVTISGLSDTGSTLLDLRDNSAALRVEYEADSCVCDDVPQPPAVLRKNGVEVSLPSTAENGDELEIELVVPYAYETTATATLTVGERVEQFSVTSREFGALVPEGTAQSPWPVLGDFHFDGYHGSVDTSASYYSAHVTENDLALDLRGLTDDIDLYVYETDDFSSTLVCSATESGTTDTGCFPIGKAGQTLYILIDGSKTQAGSLFRLTLSQ